jgi:MFS family permease
MAPAIVLASAVTALYGRLYDKWGFGKAIFPAIAVLSAGYILLFFFRSTALVFVGSLLMMCGYLSGAAVFGAMLRDYTPVGKAGMFQGLRIVAQVLIPGMVGAMIGAGVLKNAETVLNDDGTTSFIPNANIYLAALIVAVILLILLAVQVAAMKKQEVRHD